MHVYRKRNRGDRLVEGGVFGFGLLEDGDVRVSVFPKREEILVGSASFGLVPGERVSAGDAEVGQGANDFVRNDTGTSKNFLKLHNRRGAVTRRHVRDSAQVNRVQVEVQSAGPVGIATLVDGGGRE